MDRELRTASEHADAWRSSPERWEHPHPCQIKGCTSTGTMIVVKDSEPQEERTICDTHAYAYVIGSMN